MTSLLRKVKTRLAIHAHRKVRGMLEGEYTSVFHGRSIEFDDLRHYVPGDEVKDIDWKATARMGTPMTRRYIASRKHTVLLVTDTGRNMAAVAASGEQKIDIAILAAGVVGYLAARHGDLVAILAGDAEQTEYRGPESTDAHLERLLQLMASRTTLGSGRSDLSTQLAYVARGFRRRMILVVIADDRVIDQVQRRLLRRLSAQHEILWLTVGDADPTRADWSAGGMYEVADGAELPRAVRSQRHLREEFAEAALARTAAADELFDSLAISSGRVEAETDVIPGLFRLLEGHRHARR
ncbi:DUF58 domain-containing protein [Marisediminicola antarctica]|uniref:DUF58 domain-containing protein n=1 Tax=Marisediminicola antarctica TaxID=674079 RepID=A0A7L5AI09_9MICO|nr:DUF58 domain-containing protein [Marisediminicola antarctica]QHO69696.1 hypothetical protein BHD05_08630 [Marisediminicola antarctica]